MIVKPQRKSVSAGGEGEGKYGATEQDNGNNQYLAATKETTFSQAVSESQ